MRWTGHLDSKEPRRRWRERRAIDTGLRFVFVSVTVFELDTTTGREGGQEAGGRTYVQTYAECVCLCEDVRK